eukprot:COSAG06_NODE_40109_length_405_cov_1.000000_1_plen_69_part_00
MLWRRVARRALPVVAPLGVAVRLGLRGPLFRIVLGELAAAAHPLAAVRSVRLAICDVWDVSETTQSWP